MASHKTAMLHVRCTDRLYKPECTRDSWADAACRLVCIVRLLAGLRVSTKHSIAVSDAPKRRRLKLPPLASTLEAQRSKMAAQIAMGLRDIEVPQ